MRDVKIELANHNDDGELKRLQAELRMPGPYQISYLREPGFFQALTVEGALNQVIVGRKARDGSLIGWGNRSIKEMYVNGESREVGYLSGLRFVPEYNNVFTLMRGYEKLHQLHGDGKAAFYLTTILDHNLPARKLLLSAKRRLPVYHHGGQFHCKAVKLTSIPGDNMNGDVHVRLATAEDTGEIIRFLNREGRKKQFYPVYSEDDLLAKDGLLANLAVEDLVLAIQDNELTGVAGGWNQQPFRASQVKGYSGWLQILRPLYNLWSRLGGYPALPKTGTILNYFTLSTVAVRDDNQDVFKKLIAALAAEKRQQHDFMMIGLHSSHPLYPVLLEMKGLDYKSQLYLVYWHDGEQSVSELDSRPVYLELGSL